MLELIHYFFSFIRIKIKTPQHFTNDQKVHILIFENAYFSKRAWLNILKDSHILPSQKAEVLFTKNRFEFRNLLSKAEICFCFGLSRNIDLSVTPLRLIYFGLRGSEFLENREIPKNIRVDSCYAVSSEAIAEYTLMVALMLRKNFHHVIKNQVSRTWNQKVALKKSFSPVSTAKIGILGMGANGRSVAKLFHNLGCYVMGYDIARQDLPYVNKWCETGNLDEILGLSDILVVCLPLTKETKHLINLDQLSKMKPHSYIINVSRGEIIVEKELRIALKKRIIGGAAIDVFKKEPLSIWNRSWNFPEMIISPHISGNINLFVHEIQADFIRKILSIFPNLEKQH